MISIIIPVYNAEKYIEATMDSVLAQTYADWEMVLVDDGSTDSSAEVIRTYIEKHPGYEDRIQLAAQEQCGTAAEARNRGIDLSRGRYIAFLDADDLWYPDKLDLQMQYMEKNNAGFVFSAYEFGNEAAVPTGKVVHVPAALSYDQALSRTIIFTSTVLIDLEKVDRSLVYMPVIASEDTATWWRILKSGVAGYGLDRPLVIYRRPENSLSSNKAVAVKRIWNLYRKEAGLSTARSLFCLFGWAFHATSRRIVDDGIRRNFERIKNFTVVQMSTIGILLYTAVYGLAWFRWLYPILRLPRYNQDGIYLGTGLRLYFRGHLLILVIYFALLMYLARTIGSTRTGYLKPLSLFTSSVVALFAADIISYYQLSLMRNWLLPVWPISVTFVCQVFLALIWSYLSDWIYRRVFPPRETLVVHLVSGVDGSNEKSVREFAGVMAKFQTRKDRFRITRVMTTSEDELVSAKRECLRWYGCVVICGGSEKVRKELTGFCYGHNIRVYLVPDAADLLIQGSETMDLFDSPVLELKEYSLHWETLLIKRIVDIVGSLLGLILMIPARFVYRAVKSKSRKNKTLEKYSDLKDTPTQAKSVCLGKNQRPFVRKTPALLSVLRGDMSLVGPEPLREDAARAKMEADPRQRYRYRVKPGLTGYAQLYGNENSSEEDLLKMDIYYIQNAGLMMDIKILIRSVKA